MNTLKSLGLVLSLSISAAPASAQLVHLSFETQDSWLIFHSDSAAVPWHPAIGWVSEFDLHYDARLDFDAPLDASRNYWHMRIEVPELRNFEITRPIQAISAWSDSETGNSSLTFAFDRFDATHFEAMELTLIFNQLIPTSGKLPLPPFPSLGSTPFQDSSFSLQGGRSFFDFSHLADFYGYGGIDSISFTITPVPEPADYGLAAVLLLGAVTAFRALTRRTPSLIFLRPRNQARANLEGSAPSEPLALTEPFDSLRTLQNRPA